MKVTDLKQNECIHCETEEQAKDICKLMHKAGLEWKGGQSYLSKNNYVSYKSETCYFPIDGQYADLDYAKEENYKIYKAEQFLTQEKETMQTSNLQTLNSTIRINGDMKEINIEPQEGFEIDLEKSDLKNGKVLFKEVKEKYPTEFKDLGTDTFKLSTKYSHKLSILNTLLHFRDEYNRIDGFTEGFIFGEDNWCISNWRNKLDFEFFRNENKIMYFGKEETAKLFLKNFEEQLEQIKEFL